MGSHRRLHHVFLHLCPFCIAKGLQLQVKCTPFGVQNDHSCIAIVLVLHWNGLFLCTPSLHILCRSRCKTLYISNIYIARSKLANFDPTIVLLAQLAFLSDRKCKYCIVKLLCACTFLLTYIKNHTKRSIFRGKLLVVYANNCNFASSKQGNREATSKDNTIWRYWKFERFKVNRLSGYSSIEKVED